jgi:hypothetical protein
VHIISFRAPHLSQIDVQERQRRTVAHVITRAKWLSVLEHGGPAISVVVDRRIIASGGLVLQSSSSGFVWAAFARDAGRYFLKLHYAARHLLERLPPTITRIEAVTEIDFAQGRRWLALLGFEQEKRLSEDGANGEDHFLFARTRSKERHGCL